MNLDVVIVIVALTLLVACESPPPCPSPDARSWTEADALFRRGDPRWQGADAAYSIDLGDARVLWLFGDTFVAQAGSTSRSGSDFPRNTVGLQVGLDPSSATMQTFWSPTPEGGAGSFFADDGDAWFWPGHGARLPSGALVVFLHRIIATPGVGLGFGTDGWALALVEDPSGSPADWIVRRVDGGPLPFDAQIGIAAVIEGAHLVALCSRFEGAHAGLLARFPLAELEAGSLSGMQWWQGESEGWVDASATGVSPATVMDDAGPEASLHFDAALGLWIHVASRGFGRTTIAVRTAAALTGPWSAQRDVFTPPESLSSSPFVYAAKAHPELQGPEGELVITYATNSFDFFSLFEGEGLDLYWPHFVLVPREGLRAR